MQKSTTILLVVSFLLIAGNINSQTGVFISYDLQRTKYVVETSISPNGDFIAFTVHVPRPLSDGPGEHYQHLYLYDLGSAESIELIGGKSIIKSINWQPGVNNITFLAKLNGEKYDQVYRYLLNENITEVLTNASSSVIKYQISKDGSFLAYTAKSLISDEKITLLNAGFDAEIFEEESLDRNLYVLNFDSQSTTARQLTSGITVFDFKLSPDGKQIAAFIADKNLVDYSYMFKRVYLIDVVTGERQLHLNNPGKIDKLVWSPDSKHIAFIAASFLHDAVTGSLFVTEVPNTKKFDELINYAAGKDYTIRNVQWKDNNTLLFLAEDGVDITLNEQKISETERSIIIEPGQVVINNFDLSDDLISFSANTAKHPYELFSYTFEDGKLSRLTNCNPWLDKIRLAKQEKITYKARDGLEIEGTLLYPLDYKPGNRYPLILCIHGGPEHAMSNGWQTAYNKWGQIAAAKGFFVFMPNYRSSSSRGIDFTMEGFGDLVGSEFEDIIDGIDYLVEKGLVDKNKVGIGGGSYGGYFSSWAATRYTDSFAAAVVFVGIANQVSKKFTTDIPYEDYYVHWGIWTYENEDLVWERSPVRYVKGSKTPTLILGGKKDTRVHPSQNLELYRGLKLHGEAPVRLVRYPDEKHGNKKNTSRLDYSLRTMRWFEYYLLSDNPKNQMPDKYLKIMSEE